MKSILKPSILLFLIIMSPMICEEAEGQNVTNTQEEMVVEYYAIPSPDEVLNYIHNNEISYTPALLSNPNKSDLYQTSTAQMLSFGVYLADMAYAVSFGQTGTALPYFELTESMGKSMNLFPPEIQNIGERLMNNMNDLDSINALYDELYLMVIANLHDNGRFGEYALISAGGIVEALYLGLNSNGSKIKEDGFRMRVWDQKMILEQLNEMSNKYLNETQKKAVLNDMQILFSAFKDYSETSNEVATAKSREDGAVILGAPQTKAVPPKNIDKIHNAVNTLRAKWVKE